MRNLLLILLPFLASFLTLPKLFAEEVVKLKELVVKEKKIEEEAPKSLTSFTTIIDAKKFRKRVKNIPELLQETVGVNIRQYGGLGSFSTVSIRGSSAEQVAILLDGVPLNRAISGVVNISDIPIDEVERIEVYRGISPIKFGITGIGGVINIITRKPKKRLSFETKDFYGSFNTYKTNLSITQRIHGLSYLIFLDRTHSDGDFKFLNDNGTPLNKSDDRWEKRKNNDFDSEEYLLKLDYEKNGFSFLLSNDTFHKWEGVPGISSFQSTHAKLKTLRNITNFRFKEEGKIISRNLDFELHPYYFYSVQKFKDVYGEIGTGRQDNKNVTNSYGFDLNFSYYLGLSHVISFYQGVKWEKYVGEDKLARIKRGNTQKRRTYSFGLEDEIHLFSEKLILTPSIRYDYYKNDISGQVPFYWTKIAPRQSKNDDFWTRAFGFKFQPYSWLAIKGNIGKFHRVPNFYELFGDRGQIVGNTNLKPENSLNRDIGFEIRKANLFWLNSFRFSYSYFYNTIDDMILFIQNSQRTSIARNISKAKITGHEWDLFVNVGNFLTIFFNWTKEKPKDRSNIKYWRGKNLPGRPENQRFLKVSLLSKWAKIFYEYNYIGKNYLDRANTVEIKNREIQNAGFILTPKKFLSLTFEVKNFKDEHSFDIVGYPLPGRSYFVTLDLRI